MSSIPVFRQIDAMPVLLAIDIGVKTGLALYRHDGRLLWYRSQNFGTAQRLRRGVRSVLDALPHLAWLVLEGGGPLADIWRREATRRHIPVRQISAEAWRGCSSMRVSSVAARRPKSTLRPWRGALFSGRRHDILRPCETTQLKRFWLGSGARSTWAG